MTGLWMLTAAVCAAEAIWLKQWRPVRAPSDLAPAGRVRELPLPLVLEMLSVAIRQGASTSRALIAVGDIAAGDFGAGLRSAGEQLNKGVSWDDAWPDDGDLAVVRDAFASSWHSRLCNDGVCATTTEKRGMLGDDNSRSFVDKCG